MSNENGTPAATERQISTIHCQDNKRGTPAATERQINAIRCQDNQNGMEAAANGHRPEGNSTQWN